MLSWPRPAPCAARIHAQSQTTPASVPLPDARPRCGNWRSLPAAASTVPAGFADGVRPPAPRRSEPPHCTAQRTVALTDIEPAERSRWGLSVRPWLRPGRARAGDARPCACPPCYCAGRRLLAQRQRRPLRDAPGSDRLNHGPIAIKPCVGASLRRPEFARSAQPDWAARITIPVLWIFPPGNLFAKDSHDLELRPRITLNRRGESRLCWPNVPSLHERTHRRGSRRDRKKFPFFLTQQTRTGIGRAGSGSERSYICTNGEAIRAQTPRSWGRGRVPNVALCRNKNSQWNQLCRISCKYQINHPPVRLRSRFVDSSERIIILIDPSPSIRII